MATDISKIKKGDRISNYRKMCELMGEPVLTSDSKTAQIKRWETVMKLKREGNAFIVEEIYAVPLSKEDKRKLNKSRGIYFEHIKIQILHYLAAQGRKGDINFEFISQ